MSRTDYGGLQIATEQRRSRWRYRIVDATGRTLIETSHLFASESGARKAARMWVDAQALTGRAK